MQFEQLRFMQETAQDEKSIEPNSPSFLKTKPIKNKKQNKTKQKTLKTYT